MDHAARPLGAGVLRHRPLCLTSAPTEPPSHKGCELCCEQHLPRAGSGAFCSTGRVFDIGGRNIPAQIAKDAEDWREAARPDEAALREALLERGVSRGEIRRAFNELDKSNRADGWH